MKYALSYIFSLILVFSACRKDDKSVFDLSPDERINQALSQYKAALVGAPNGWNATITTGSGHFFHFHFRFNDANRTTMYADIDTTTAGTAKESGYRLKALQQPSLIFDTYSYLHTLADPDGTVNGGDDGIGLQSDFEFSIDTVTADSIQLTGRLHNTKVTLHKASQQDEAAWQNGDWEDALGLQYIGYIQEYFKRLSLNGVAYDVRINQRNRTITFIWLDVGGNARQFTTTYYYTSQGMILTTPFNDGTRTINSLTSAGWDAANRILQVKVNGTTAGTIAGAIRPAQVDLDAPERWWQYVASQASYWITFRGFHANGVDDAFHIRDIPNFYFLLFWPAYDVQNGITYDVLGYVTINGTSLSLDFGSAWMPPTFTADGRVIFEPYGTLGTVPPAAAAAFANTNTQFAQTSGYYLVQTSATTYDMVSAKDAKAWITWEY